jgi:hypothetical protein
MDARDSFVVATKFSAPPDCRSIKRLAGRTNAVRNMVYMHQQQRRMGPTSLSFLPDRRRRFVDFLFPHWRELSTGTLRKNVTLVQKSSKTSVEQSFFEGCPSYTCS